MDVNTFVNKKIIRFLFSLAEVRVAAENLHFSGLSNIVIENVNFNALFNRLRFSFVLPQLLMSVGRLS